MLIKIIIYLSIGTLVGFFNAVSGGGSILSIPVMVFLGINPIIATTTANIPIFIGQIGSVLAQVKNITKIPKRYLWLILTVLVGGSIGAYLLKKINLNIFEILFVLLTFLLIIGVVLFPYLTLNLYQDRGYKEESKRFGLYRSLMFFLVAISGGFYNPGFGIATFYLINSKDFNNKGVVNNLKNVLMLVESGIVVIVFYTLHLLDIRVGMAIGAGAFLGGFIGSKLYTRISLRYLRWILILICFAVIIYILNFVNMLSFGDILKHLL